MSSRIAVLLLSFFLAAAGTQAQDLAGVKLPESYKLSSGTLVLNGAAVHEAFFAQDYVGALYLPAQQSDASAILNADAPRRMVIHFLFSVDKKQMADAWRGGLKTNTSKPSPEVKAAFDKLVEWTADVIDGTEIVLTYSPGNGTAVQVNGAMRGILPGKETADAILATWIGPKPQPGDAFKKGVLGR